MVSTPSRVCPSPTDPDARREAKEAKEVAVCFVLDPSHSVEDVVVQGVLDETNHLSLLRGLWGVTRARRVRAG